MKNTRLCIVLGLVVCIASLYLPTHMISETKAAYVTHAPIIITCDEDFVTQGWPTGEGPKVPYLIEGLNITSTGVCIYIVNTTRVFIIRNCLLSSSISSGNPAIRFENLRIGSVMDCQIEEHLKGIYISNSTYCWLSNNTISSEGNGAVGIHLISSHKTTLYDNTAYLGGISNPATAYLLESSDDCTLDQNFASILGDPSHTYVSQLGFDLDSSQRCTLTNNFVQGQWRLMFNTGFYLNCSDDCILINNSAIEHGGYGFIIRSNRCQIMNNTVSESRYGFWVTGKECNLTENTAERVSLGFDLDGAQACNLINNTAEFSALGFYIHTFYGSNIVNNTARNSNTHGFYVYQSRNIILTRNTALDNNQAGFCLNYTNNCTLTNNTATNNCLTGGAYNVYGGFWLQHVFNCTLEKNVAINNLENNIFLEHVDSCTIKDNYVSGEGNDYYGIHLYNCHFVFVSNNHATGSYRGFLVEQSSRCDFTGNIAASNVERGFEIWSSEDCTFSYNNIYDNSIGISIIGSSLRNVFFLNWIGPNDINAKCDTVDNKWDDGISQGNHWSDYNGTGVYAIQGPVGSIDRFPFGMKPHIDHPTDIQYEEGSIGHSITWHPASFYPASYMLIIQTGSGQGVGMGPWDGSDFTVSVDGLSLGSYNYTLRVYDTTNNYTSDTVVVTVEDTTIPIINVPPDLIYESGATGHTINWSIYDLHFASYEIQRNGDSIEGKWDGGNLTLTFDDLPLGVYNYTLIVQDSSGNTATDTVFITVVDNTSPTVDRPANIVLEFGITGQIIQWTPLDLHPGEYLILQNGSEVASGDWDGTSISISIDGLAVGSYNYTIVVYDTSNNSISDIVIVTVKFTSTQTETENSLLQQGIPYTIGFGIGLVPLIMVLLFKRRH